MIEDLRHRQFIRLEAIQLLVRPDPQAQPQLTVDPVHALVVPFGALHVAQKQKAQPKALGLAINYQTNQPVCYLGVLTIELALIAITCLADLERAAGQCDADRLIFEGVHGNLSLLRLPYRFFLRTSFSKSFCMLISAYIRFRR